MATGRKIRLARLINAHSRRSLLLPLDHGVTVGPIAGISDIQKVLGDIVSSGADVQGVILHRGVMTKSCSADGRRLPAPLVLHLSASTTIGREPSNKVLVAQVEDALAMGAEAVSIHVNLGVLTEPKMLRDFGFIANQCERWGMPLLAMMYTHDDPSTGMATNRIKHSARLAAELGADLIKVAYPGSPDAMAEVVDGCFAPIVVAGGQLCSTETEILDLVAGALAGGAGGVCIGRNVFQHSDPRSLLKTLSDLVHGAESSQRSNLVVVPPSINGRDNVLSF